MRKKKAKKPAPDVKSARKTADVSSKDTEPDWGGKCEVCGQSPIVPLTGMCGPCTYGEADTADGNW